jgi:hydroxymethylpyrimidine kinase/phosphomethylpyrimidine kinase
VNSDGSSPRSDSGPNFRPLVVGPLYPSIERGLSADLAAARALDGSAYSACTAHVVASDGLVTDVLDVPTDSVSAQIEHVVQIASPTAAKVSAVGHPATVERVFDLLTDHLDDGPLVLDLTLSGPSGEDLSGPRVLDALAERYADADLVTLRRTDAERAAGMAIPSLDDAQVALQRLADLGAQALLMRCGRLPTHHFDTDSEPPPYAVDLFYDGDEFALFEAPHLQRPNVHGASSALLLALLHQWRPDALPEALQHAKAFVTESLRRTDENAAAIRHARPEVAAAEPSQTEAS